MLYGLEDALRLDAAVKFLVLGFDGASPTLIERWLGELPNIRRLKRVGLFGTSTPPIPAQTPVAWATFMTGMNPGKHGVFSFVMKEPGGYNMRIASPAMLGGRTLWSLLSEAGFRVGVVNVPMAGLEKLRGFIIPGFLSKQEGVPHPEGVQRLVQREFGVDRVVGDVEVDYLKRVGEEPDAFLKRVNSITDQNADIGVHLLEQMEPDFYMQVFMGTDRIQHFFWRHVDPEHPNYEEGKYTQAVKQYYKKVDDIIGRFLKIVGGEAMVMVLSDHGFRQLHMVLPVNRHLRAAGLLKSTPEGVDWQASKAFSYGYGDIWLNVKGREPTGTVEPGEEYERLRNRIINMLKSMEFNGEKPIKDVLRREDVYWGPRVNEAPDLVAIFNVGWQAARDPEKELRGEAPVEEPARWSGTHDGAHDPADVPGFLAISGPGVRVGEINANLWDLAPTILRAFGVPIPPSVDGSPLPL